jgi:hypothetical protein
MMSTRRLALSLLSAASLTASLVAASPAVALQPAQYRSVACGASVQDYDGAFTGTFDRAPGDTISATFSAPQSVTTDWTVEGWQGHGRGTYELTDTGVKWDNSDEVTGPATGVDTETYRSTAVSCAEGSTEVETIRGEVVAADGPNTVVYPFTITRVH